MSKVSKLAPSKVIEAALSFFGPSGIGLAIVEEGECCARLEGAGGNVFIQTEELEGKKGSQVIIEGREFDYQIKEFLGKI
jgi:hypothetical protein